jgi:hypothetical protein
VKDVELTWLEVVVLTFELKQYSRFEKVEVDLLHQIGCSRKYFSQLTQLDYLSPHENGMSQVYISVFSDPHDRQASNLR